MKIIGIVPARYASTRFPGKPLQEIDGKTMIHRVLEQVGKAKLIDKTVVATDDKRIFDHVNELGYEAMMTNPTHESGTDRCAEVVQRFKEQGFEGAVNIQGDEPFIQPEQIDALCDFLSSSENFSIVTLAKKIETTEVLFNPNAVKVIFGENRQALYFSRQAIPFIRGENEENWLKTYDFFQHIGLYGYQTAVLSQLAQLEKSNLEKAESLEQLRWLENGFSIGVLETTTSTFGIDTPADLTKALNWLKNKKGDLL